MKKRIIPLALAFTILISACSSATTENIVSEEETTTNTTIENTTETTTEKTTEETTEATTTVTFPEGGLQMPIEDVTQAIVEAMGSEYTIFTADKDIWSEVYENSDGIVNLMTCGRVYTSEENEFDGYNGIYILFEIYEFDMDSEAYKLLCDTNEFPVVRVYRQSKQKSEYTVTTTAINKQYAITVFASYMQDGSIDADLFIMAEQEPPFTIGNTQAGYEAFLALE